MTSSRQQAAVLLMTVFAFFQGGRHAADAAATPAPPFPAPPATSGSEPHIAIVTSSAWCYHDDVRYQHGDQWEPNSCTHCQCMHGRSLCYVIDCFFSECVDFEYVPGKCCPICPNGPNCNLNGTIVSVGQEVYPDPNTTCSCVLPETGIFAFRRPGVMCTTVLERPAQVS